MAISTIGNIGAKPLLGKIRNSPISIGRFTYGFNRVDIIEWGGSTGLKIGSFCSIASATIYLDGNHTINWFTTFPFAQILDDHDFYPELGGLDGFEVQEPPSSKGDVVIGNDVWIGEKVTILPGVNVGDGAVLGACSLITKDVEPYAIVGGNPATLIRKRFSNDVINLLLQLRWWDLPIDKVREIKRHLLTEPSVGALHFLIAKYRA
jgi:acetyltransferase-like isoleucine patch superfamily enzyme